MKWKYRKLLKSKIRGFSFIEVLISIFLISIIMLSAVNVLIGSEKLKEGISQRSKEDLDREFAIQYITNEIDRSHMIIIDEKNLRRDWIGVVLVTDMYLTSSRLEDRYSYTTFILDGKSIKRGNYKYGALFSKIDFRSFHTPNTILKDISSFRGEFDADSHTLKISLKDLSDNEYEYYHIVDSVIYE